MQFDTTRSLDLIDATPRPAAPPTPPDRSAWGSPWRALKAGVAEVAGSTADTIKGFGAAASMSLAADPFASAVVGDQALREGAAEGRRQIDSGEALVSDVGNSFRQVSRDLRPDPVTASKAEELIFGVVRPLSKLVGAGLTLGPIGLGLASAEEGFTQSDDLRLQGVDFATRTKVGGLSAGVTAAGAFLPMAGPTLKATAGLYLLGGPGAFMAQQQATRTILERADYGELAKQYDPLDLAGLGMSMLIPLPFAAHGAARNIGAARAARQVGADLAAGRAPDGSELPTEQAPPAPREVVDAAMVHNLTAHADAVEAAIAAGAPPFNLIPESSSALAAAALPVGIKGATAEVVTERGLTAPVQYRLVEAGDLMFAKAYGDPALVAMLSESADSNVRNVLNGLLRAAPDVARLNDLAAAGARQPVDVAGNVVRAVQEFAKLRADGMTVDQYLAQGSLLDGGLPPEINNLLVGLGENARSPRRVAEMVRELTRAVDGMGDPRQPSLLDGNPASAADVTANAVERLRAITDEQLTDTPPATVKTSTDPMMRMLTDRVQGLEVTAPELPVRLDADGKPVSLADDLARVRKEAAEGTDAELGAMDADLLRVAAECALSAGAM